MGEEAIKLELIEWLTKLEDKEMIEYLKIIKDSNSNNHDWWSDLSDSQKEGIQRGMNDIDAGKTTPHEEVRKKFGL